MTRHAARERRLRLRLHGPGLQLRLLLTSRSNQARPTGSGTGRTPATEALRPAVRHQFPRPQPQQSPVGRGRRKPRLHRGPARCGVRSPTASAASPSCSSASSAWPCPRSLSTRWSATVRASGDRHVAGADPERRTRSHRAGRLRRAVPHPDPHGRRRSALLHRRRGVGRDGPVPADVVGRGARTVLVQWPRHRDAADLRGRDRVRSGDQGSRPQRHAPIGSVVVVAGPGPPRRRRTRTSGSRRPAGPAPSGHPRGRKRHGSRRGLRAAQRAGRWT